MTLAKVAPERDRWSDLPVVAQVRQLFDRETNAKKGVKKKSTIIGVSPRGFGSLTFQEVLNGEEV